MAYATVVPGGAKQTAAPTGPYAGLNAPATPAKPVTFAPPQSAAPFGSSYDTTSASHVTVDPSILNSMQQYQNAAYANQQRTLDPQWQQQQNQFDQQMVGQGVQPGSAAYNNAYQNFIMGKNDAYTSAYNNSFQTGLAAQGQAFNQGYQNSQLANSLATARIGANATLGASANNMAASEYGADKSYLANQNNNATNQLLGLGNLGLGYGQLQNQSNQNDFNDMLSLYGVNSGATQYNNGLIGGAQNTLMGLIPNSSPTPIDATGAYALNAQGAQSQYQGQVASANGTNQMVGTALTTAVLL